MDPEVVAVDAVAHRDVDMEAVEDEDMAVVVVDSGHAITVRTAVEEVGVEAEGDARQDRGEAVVVGTEVEATGDTMAVGHQVETMAVVTEGVAAEEVVPTGGARTRD